MSNRSKKANRILRPDEKQKSKETIPIRLTNYERFFASLLGVASCCEYFGESCEVRKTICDRLSLPVPYNPLLSSYENQKDHFMNRAALVMEEARQNIADGLRLLQDDFKNIERSKDQFKKKSHKQQQQHSHNGKLNLISIDLSMVGVEQKGTSRTLVTFSKKHKPFTREELLGFRHGSVVGCLQGKLSPTIENVMLGNIIPQNKEELVRTNTIVVMFFKKIKKKVDAHSWKVIPIISLLSEQRKFEACSNLLENPVSFLLPLLGKKKPTHIQCIDNNDRDVTNFNSSEMTLTFDASCADSNNDCEILKLEQMDDTFKVPTLNKMQERASDAFLGSNSDTITLVQGPPGTGKTTLLTTVICRYVIESRKLERSKRCLLVCAPTNKAVIVLFKRFLDTFVDNESFPCNVVIFGDEDKLFENENCNRINNSYRALRENFLYTFIDSIRDDYKYIRKVLNKGNFGLLRRISHVARKLLNFLSIKVSGRKEILTTAFKIVQLLEDFSGSRNKKFPIELMNLIDFMLGTIDSLNHDDIFQEIIGLADVIFCTLGSAGTSFLKRSITHVDDLIVDEAAAAIEPDIYIPFEYQPRRLLCVGDPRQLPATIRSRFAERMGLRKSLHERLMYDCCYDHIMLDTQYRMCPALSQFPSKQFYDGKLRNGMNVTCSKHISILGSSSYTLYQVDGKEQYTRSGSIENQAEANAVVKIVENLKQVSGNSPDWCSIDRVRVITFYQAQENLIRRQLRRRNLGNVLVATVDSSQGCEADLIVLSFVRSEGNSRRKTLGFLMDDRRLNVAMTRAKYQIIGVGNFRRMANLADKNAGGVKALAMDATNRNCILAFPSSGSIPNKKRKKALSESKSENRTYRMNVSITNKGRKKMCIENSNSNWIDSKSNSANTTSRGILADPTTKSQLDVGIDKTTSSNLTCKNEEPIDPRIVPGDIFFQSLQSSELSKNETTAVFEDFSS